MLGTFGLEWDCRAVVTFLKLCCLFVGLRSRLHVARVPLVSCLLGGRSGGTERFLDAAVVVVAATKVGGLAGIEDGHCARWMTGWGDGGRDAFWSVLVVLAVSGLGRRVGVAVRGQVVGAVSLLGFSRWIGWG